VCLCIRCVGLQASQFLRGWVRACFFRFVRFNFASVIISVLLGPYSHSVNNYVGCHVVAMGNDNWRTLIVNLFHALHEMRQ